MRRTKRNNKEEYGKNYTIFLGLERKFRENWTQFSSHEGTFASDLTPEEIGLLNGYKANTGDGEVGVFQTLGLNSVEFNSRQATYRLAMYCMALDG